MKLKKRFSVIFTPYVLLSISMDMFINIRLSDNTALTTLTTVGLSLAKFILTISVQKHQYFSNYH